MFSNIQIVPFQPQDQVVVKELILAGLGEHWGEIDHTLNPDLNDISTTYKKAIFLVVWHHERIIGTGALVPHTHAVGEIVRMSVAKDMRRKGIGRLMLDQLILRAKSAGYTKVILETTETWHEVIAFYQQYGFQITHYQDGDVYFALPLG